MAHEYQLSKVDRSAVADGDDAVRGGVVCQIRPVEGRSVLRAAMPTVGIPASRCVTQLTRRVEGPLQRDEADAVGVPFICDSFTTDGGEREG